MRAALVTGVCGGIGGAVARRLLDDGWRVYGIDVADARRAPEGVVFERVDVGNARQRAEAFGGLAELRDVRALVNVAATQHPGRFEDTDPTTWARVLDVNLTGPAELTRMLLPALTRQGGAIVNIASVHARATSSGLVPYAASKAGLAGLTRALAVELAPRGIRVNSVLPGAVDTPMLGEGLDRSPNRAKAWSDLVSRTPVGRVGRPGDIAELVAFLVGDWAGFITGQEIVIDGGVLAVLSSESGLTEDGEDGTPGGSMAVRESDWHDNRIERGA